MSQSKRTYLDGKVTLYCGDARDALREIPDNSIDSVVTDPPYALVSIVKRFGAPNAAPAKSNGATGVYQRASAGFMGKTWDTGETAFAVEFWSEVMRVIKPGGHVVAFSGTRTYHRLACAIEDAGFEIRDMISTLLASDTYVRNFMQTLSTEQQLAFLRCIEESSFGGMLEFVYGSGFPKSLDVSKAIDKAAGAERVLTRAGIVERAGYGDDWDTGSSSNRPRYDAPATDAAKQWNGWGTALKPSHEPIVLARKSLIGTVAANVLAHGTGALNIDGCRIGVSDNDDIHAKNPHTKGGFGHADATVFGSSDGAPAYDPGKGRFPANLILDGSEEARSGFPDTGTSSGGSGDASKKSALAGHVYGQYSGDTLGQNAGGLGDSGSAARYFYTAKADAEDRLAREYEDIEVSWISEQGSCQAKLLVDTGPSPAKVIAVSGSGESSEWSTFLFGSTITARFPKDTKFTIETATSSTTDSKILRLLTRSLTKGSTAAASPLTANGGSPAVNATRSSPSLTIISEKTVSLPGASHAKSGTPLRISAAGKRGNHPTVKPLDLMQYLVRLVTRKGGVVLDPFAGTGTTGEAAWREGMQAVLIEREEEYQADIERRMDLCDKPTKRAAVAKTKNQLDDPLSLPLFASLAEPAEDEVT